MTDTFKAAPPRVMWWPRASSSAADANGFSGVSAAAADAKLKVAQLGQPAQAADSGVARIGLFVKVIEQLVAVVGAHGQAELARTHELDKVRHDSIHVHIAFQVVGFVEIAFRIALGTAQVEEVDAVGSPCRGQPRQQVDRG